ncbi:MAG: hypothetical protein ACE5OS_11455, partial [Anaerolineae bacterium]
SRRPRDGGYEPGKRSTLLLTPSSKSPSRGRRMRMATLPRRFALATPPRRGLRAWKTIYFAVPFRAMESAATPTYLKHTQAACRAYGPVTVTV